MTHDLREALEKIRRTPSMPFPDPGAHSAMAWGRAVYSAWQQIQSIARAALSEGEKRSRSQTANDVRTVADRWWDADAYQRAEEHSCTCGAAGSGEGHTDWCKWLETPWHHFGEVYVALKQTEVVAGCTPHSVRSQALEEAIAALLDRFITLPVGGSLGNDFLAECKRLRAALIPLPAPDGGSAAAAAPFVPAEHLFLLRWLGENDFSQYGECYGKSLDALVALGLAQIHDGDEHQSSFIAKGRGGMYRAVFLTDAGRGALKQVADVAAEGQGGAVIGVANTPLPAPDAGWRDAQALEAAHRLIAFHERCKGHVSHASAADALTVARAYVALPAPPVGGSAS